MALPAIKKKKTVNDLIKDYNTAKSSSSKIVPNSTTKTSTTTKSAPTAPTSSYAQSFIGKNSVKEPVTHESPYLNVNANTLVNGGVVKAPTTTSSGSGGTATTPVTNTENVADILRANYPTLSGGGSYSSSAVVDPSGMIDISNMLKAYEDAAAANRAVVEQSYSERRNDLLTSLKRFQEQNAKDVASQQKTYLANQALVESAIAEADRNNRINAAARGLGGSGLQQLSQLQTLMSQGQTISDLATQNQETVNNLREVLANYDEDTQTALADLVKTKENSLKGIESELGTNKASLEYQAREKAADRAHAQQMAEAATAAQIAAQNEAYARESKQQQDALEAELAYAQKQYEKDLASAKTSKKIKEAKETYETSIATTLRDYMIPSSNSTYNSAYDYLTNEYTNKLNNYTNNLEKRTSLWNWITNPSDYMDAKDEIQGNRKFRLW